MKLQISAVLLLANVVFAFPSEKTDKKSAEPEKKPIEKKDKRGLFDLGDFGGHGGFESGGHGGFESGGHGLELGGSLSDDHHHTTYDFKEIKVGIPAPYPVHIEKKVPVPYPVKVPIHVDHPVPYPVIKPYPVHVEKPVPYPVIKNIPYPVKVPYKVPYPVEVKVPVEKPYPVPVIKNVPVHIPYPVHIEKQVPVLVKSHHEEGFGGFGGEHGHYH